MTAGAISLSWETSGWAAGCSWPRTAPLVVSGSVVVHGEFRAEAEEVEVTGSITAAGGQVTLHSQSTTIIGGSIDVSSATGRGGSADVFGPTVALINGGRIDASGALGGGSVRRGRRLSGAQSRRSQFAVCVHWFRQRDSHDAGEHGDAGSIVVWADNATQILRPRSAHGGSEDGSGGQVEISGKGQLQFHGQVDLGAAHGDIGTLLLDPTNIVIASGSGDSASDGTATFKGTPSNVVGQILSADTGPTTIYETELEGLAATANIILQATNDVTINDLSDNTLNLAATTGSLTIRADANGNGTGNFSMNTGDTIRTQGGAVTIRGASLTAIGTINTTGSAGKVGGAISLTADNGVVSVTGA